MPDPKITSKNLSYDTSLPPFLARLHAQAAGADGPDPILSARRRPRGPGRSASEEAEDAPLVVDESGNAVALRVGDDGEIIEEVNSTKADDGKEGEDDKEDKEGKEDKEDKKKASFGGSARKRKAGKVVGADDEAADGERNDAKSATKTSSPNTSKNATDEPAKQKPKKKAKKIKLSFDQDE